MFCPVNKILQCYRLQNPHNCLLHLGPDLPGDTIICSCTVTFVFNTLDRNDRSLQAMKNIAKFNLLWSFGKQIPSFGASDASDKSCLPKNGHQLLEIFDGYFLMLSNDLQL